MGPMQELVGRLLALEARIAELELAAARPRFKSGVITGTTDGNGDLVISHGLVVAPAVVVATALVSNAIVRVQAKSASTFTLRFLNVATGAALASTSLSCDWIAVA